MPGTWPFTSRALDFTSKPPPCSERASSPSAHFALTERTFRCTRCSRGGRRPISTPPNPWLSSEVEYLDEIPDAKLEVYEDHTREILSHNDSPDLGFSWSVNPYRGCFSGCAYCVAGHTSVLMADGTTRVIRDLRVGDAIYGTVCRGEYRRY